MLDAFALAFSCVPVGIMSSAVEIKIWAINSGIKKSIIKKKKKDDKVVLLENNKFNTIEALISQALIDLYISHDDFVSVKNSLKGYNEMRDEINFFL